MTQPPEQTPAGERCPRCGSTTTTCYSEDYTCHYDGRESEYEAGHTQPPETPDGGKLGHGRCMYGHDILLRNRCRYGHPPDVIPYPPPETPDEVEWTLPHDSIGYTAERRERSGHALCDARLASLQASNTELRERIDEYDAGIATVRHQRDGHARRAERYEKALRPFAAAADFFWKGDPDSRWVRLHAGDGRHLLESVTIGDFRRARTALSDSTTGDQAGTAPGAGDTPRIEGRSPHPV